MAVPASFSEFDLIQEMIKPVRVFSGNLVTGIGDDCAVISGEGRRDFLATADLLIEDVHFSRKWFTLEEIGEKAFRVNLSDIAAMGGKPEFALVTLALPATLSREEIGALYDGIRKTAEQFQTTIAGGDLSGTPGGIAIDIMLIGTVEKGSAILRSGAKPGDRVFVSGTVGDATVGLRVLQKGMSGPASDFLAGRHRRPEPRIPLGQVLAGGGRTTSMIDISDGLSSDLMHLCRSSGVGVRIRTEALPISEPCRKICHVLHWSDIDAVLQGGEDYELLFTMPREASQDLKKASLPVDVTEIGEVLPEGAGAFLEFPDGRRKDLFPSGFDHFLHIP